MADPVEVTDEEYERIAGPELTEEDQLKLLTLGGQLRYLRLRLGLTQAQTARLFGMRQPRLSCYETGATEPRAKKFVYLRARMLQMLEELEQDL